MIQMLPLLPPDWGTWKWDEGNLNATTEQTQQSYQALIEKGLCANFSRLVWNDIVDLTANALENAGIPWDSRYGSAESCKITEQMGAFMANMFNGVATNIDRLGLFRWKWEVNHQQDGYLGRANVNGVSTHGERADNIYAWYILELVKRLNWFLSILKDEADFSEHISMGKSQLIMDPKLAGLAAAPSRSYEKILSSCLSKARTLQIIPHKSAIYGSSLSDGELSARDISFINSVVFGTSSIDAVSRMIYTLSIRVASLFAQSTPYAILCDVSTISLSHEQKSTTSVFALMEASLRELRYILGALSSHIAEITISPEIVLCVAPTIESLSPSALTPSLDLSIISGEQANSHVDSILRGSAGNIFEANWVLHSYTNTQIDLKRIGTIYGYPFIETNAHSVFDTVRSVPGQFVELSRSDIFAKPKVVVSKGVRFAGKAKSRTEDIVKLVRSASSTSTCLSESIPVTYASALRTVGLAQTDLEIMSKTSSMIGASRCFYISSNAIAESAYDAKAGISTPQILTHNSKSNDFVVSGLIQQPRHLMSACGASNSTTDSAFNVQPTKHPESTKILECYSNAEISTLALKYSTASNFAGTNVSCELGTAWYPPIWVNGGLWIRQSCSVTQNENGELVIS